MKKIVYLPVDERPCNYKFPKMLSEAFADIDFVEAPFEIMGDFRKPSDFNQIKRFLVENCKNADVLVIGLEELLYGGLVPSRNHFLSEEEILTRLELLKKLKHDNPKLKIYAFSLIMRCPCYNGSDEEPEYFLDHGEDIYNYGVLLDKFKSGLFNEDQYNLEAKKYLDLYSSEINDYVTRREINLNVLIKTLDLVGNILDFFVIPQDDSSKYGFTAIDKRLVFNTIKERNLNIPVYCGCDEVGMVLIGRALLDLKNKKIKVKCVFPKPECEDIYPLYEGSSLKETLKLMLETAGFERVENSEDVIMYLNYPTKELVNMGNKPSEGYALRDMVTFNNKVIKDIKENKFVMLCDGAYGNGGEKEWLIDLTKEISIFDVKAYAGWNTSSNALGTVLFQGIVYYLYKNDEVNNLFLAERVIEDIGYCGAVRWDVWHYDAPAIGFSYEHAGEKDGEVSKIIKRKLDDFMEKNFKKISTNYSITKCEVPWKRLFEVDLEIEKSK